MPAEICDELKEAIVSRICAIAEGVFVCRCKEYFPRKGTRVYVCEDKESGSWLEVGVENLDLGQRNLKVGG